jgi:hypothetical protein
LQCNLSVVRVAEDSQPYITVSSETTGFPFRRLLRLAEITAEVFLRLAEITAEVFLPASARVSKVTDVEHTAIDIFHLKTF